MTNITYIAHEKNRYTCICATKEEAKAYAKAHGGNAYEVRNGKVFAQMAR